MELLPHNPVDGVYATGGDWVHAMEVRAPERFLFVSGTMGLRADFTAPDTIEEQLVCVWDNLRAILASAGMTTANIVRLTSYLGDVNYAKRMLPRDLPLLASVVSRRRRSS